MTQTGGMYRATIENRWRTLLPDPAQCEEWQRLFTFVNISVAEEFRPHFTDARTAHAWAALGVEPDIAGFLHAHGQQPDLDAIEEAQQPAISEASPGEWFVEENGARLALLLVHPHLTKEDRDAIVAARLTITEAHALITSGRYDRATLTTLAGLT